MDLFLYILKVNLAIGILYIVYTLFLQRDTFFQSKRICLLLILVFSFIYPFLHFSSDSFHNPAWNEVVRIGISPIYNLQEIIVTTSNQEASWWSINNLYLLLCYIYIIVCIFLLIKMIGQIGVIIFNKLRAEVIYMYGQKIYKIQGLKSPHSFFNWIFMDPENYSEEEINEILLHETTHVRQLHSLDTILSEITYIFCWFNPFIWFLRKEIWMNLEFLADRSVIDSGCETKHYQYHLLHISYHKAAAKLSNNFNVSPLKKRIFMMNKKKTSNISIIKYALFIPLFLFFMFSNNLMKANNEKNKQREDFAQTDSPVSQELSEPNDDPIKEEEIYTHVEVMPEFPGGQKSLNKWLSENIIYPAEALKEGIEGKVIVQFVITKDGSVKNAKLIRSKNKLLDEEGVRVINKMPKWIPGTQKGKAVPVYFTLPITFKISSDDNGNNS